MVFFLEGKKEKRVLSNESTQCDKIIFTISTCLVLYTLKNIKALKNVQIIDIINIGGDLKLWIGMEKSGMNRCIYSIQTHEVQYNRTRNVEKYHSKRKKEM